MLKIRKSDERGHEDHGWLDSRHTFSFADYYDPKQMGFRSLRVINEDRVLPGEGFPPHSHRDMEIVSIVLDGEISHKDSLGNGSIIRPGDVQRMTAGTGVMHSEFNPSKTEPLHFMQIWILPKERGLKPGYEQKSFGPEETRGRLKLVASPDGREGSVTVHQDASINIADLEPSQHVSHSLGSNRHAWVQVARGAVKVNGQRLEQGDGAAVSEEKTLEIEAVEPAKVVVFDLN